MSHCDALSSRVHLDIYRMVFCFLFTHAYMQKFVGHSICVDGALRNYSRHCDIDLRVKYQVSGDLKYTFPDGCHCMEGHL